MRRHWRLLLVLALAAVVLLGVLSGGTGVASGVEWSPELFRHRSFRYFQFAGVQISPKQTREWASALETYLHAEGFVPQCDADHVTWEFVRGTAPGVRGWGGAAKILCKGMGCWDGEGANEWIEWSRIHPDLAKVLWPEIVRRAQQQQYVEVYFALQSFGDMMRAAKTVDDVHDVLRRADLVEK